MYSIETKLPQQLPDGTWLVVCKLKNQKFVPVFTPEVKLEKKLDWTSDEDRMLTELVLFKGSKKWTEIANLLNTNFHNGQNARLAKHCRQRWINHLDPTLKATEWTPEEEDLILKKHSLLGNKWSKITKLLPWRTENQVKNRWRSLQRKQSKLGEQCKIHVEWGGEVGSGCDYDSGISELVCDLDEKLVPTYFLETDSPFSMFEPSEYLL
jgi:hypothetical protein